MFECSVSDDYVPTNGSHIDIYQIGVEWLPIAELDRRLLYPQVLKSILANGLTALPFAYLGDVN